MGVAVLEQFFHNIAGKLLSRQAQQTTLDNNRKNGIPINVSPELKDVLNHIVPVLIVEEFAVTLHDLIQNHELSFFVTVLQDSLKDATAVWVTR